MDVLGNMLTKIRNAGNTKKEKVDIPRSKLKVDISKILKSEGFIKNYKEIKDNKQGIIRIILKYDDNGDHVIRKAMRISKPGLRKYCEARAIPKVKNGMGIAIMSTSKGVMTGYAARKNNCGGEVICYVW